MTITEIAKGLVKASDPKQKGARLIQKKLFHTRL